MNFPPAITPVEFAATLLFGIAVFHTFLASRFQHLARRFREGTFWENLFHLLGEVEIVFGFWGAILIAFIGFHVGLDASVDYMERLEFTEPLFVFVIMSLAATRPITEFCLRLISKGASFLPFGKMTSTYFICMFAGPLLGSFITEPAAMTVTALILRRKFFEHGISERFKYVTLGTLFVNVSIGGVLTPFAAPPILMVARKWNFDLSFMLHEFGWKAALAVFANTVIAVSLLRRELGRLPGEETANTQRNPPLWLTAVHIVFLFLVVMTSHHSSFFIGIFLLFIGFVNVTSEHQDSLNLRQSLLVAFFLAGLVVLGGPQKWWLQPLLARLDAFQLYMGATFLTSFTDNAALTYLGSQVENVSTLFKYALVAGAVTGGGLTVIANAPNPAGFSILQDKFGPDGISSVKLFLYAALPTVTAIICFWFLARPSG